MSNDESVSVDNPEKPSSFEVDVKTEIKDGADRIIETFKKDGKTPVITEKTHEQIAPSGDPHDYVSNTRYKMWRNERGNLAWDDGVPNPEANRYSDVKKVEEFKIDIFYTSEAAIEAVRSGENPTEYKEYLNTALSRWFVDDNTKMNPTLEYAQLINGEETGQYFGIIEGTDFLFVLEQVQKLQEKNLVNQELLPGIKEWYEDYLKWLTTSEKGKKEMEKENNHGTWYDVQVAQIADFIGDRDKVLQTMERAKKRIGSQITSEGNMPLEKERADSYGYPLYNLDAYSKLALVGEKYGQDLWNYTSENGGSLKKAFEYFALTLPDEKTHPIPAERNSQMYPALRAAAKAYKNPQFYSLPEKYFPTKGLDDKTEELYNRIADEITR